MLRCPPGTDSPLGQSLGHRAQAPDQSEQQQFHLRWRTQPVADLAFTYRRTRGGGGGWGELGTAA